MRSTNVLAAAIAAGVVVVGCSDPATVRGPLHGSVTVDGRPLPSGRILIFALSGGGVGTEGVIQGGRYEIAPAKGPTRGVYRVEILTETKTGRKVPDPDGGTGAMRDEVRNTIPARYNTESTLQMEYDPAVDKAYDFALTSK